MRKQIIFAAFAAFIAVDCALAAEPTLGSITRSGVYVMVGPPTGPWKIGAFSPTTEIRAKQGLRFGVDFEITGISESSAFVVATLNHPPIVKPDGSSATQSVARMGPFPVENGRIASVYGFTFDHPYEIVPGNWQIQISYQNHVLAEKSFHVIAQP